MSGRGLTRGVLATSALGLGAVGVAALFMPEAVGTFFGLATTGGVGMQVAAAGFLALAALNWMGRGAIYGGIFGRPIIVANLMFGGVSSLSSISALLDGRAEPRLWLLAALLGLHTLAFGWLLRSPPH